MPDSTPQTVPELQRIDDVGDQIGLLAGHLNAVNCRLLELIAEFDELQGYAEQGAATCAHWLNWKCGFGLNAAREKVRTARALGSLPAIHQSFAAGRISYSKVRAMTRVATPKNEDTLLNIALHGTATHIEKLVRGYRWKIREEEDKAEDKKRQDSRYCDYHWDEDGCLVIHARLTPEQGALVVKAIEAGQSEIEADVTAVTSDHPPVLPDTDGNPEPEASQNVTAVTPAMLQLWEDRPKWRADAFALMAESFLANGPQAMKGGDKHQIVVLADAGVMARDSDRGECCLDHGPHIAVATLRRMACDASTRHIALDASGEPINIGRKSRTIPPPMRRALLLRDGGCRFPGCSQTRFVDGHHIRHWANGGETSLENLVTLCRHHHRLVHEGGFSVRRAGANLFRFQSPRGNLIPDAAPAPRPVGNLDRDVRRMNQIMGVHIDGETLGLWDGTRMEYSEVVETLQLLDQGLIH